MHGEYNQYHTSYAVIAACWIGADVEVNVSDATAAIASWIQRSSFGNTNTPRRHPPAPHHFERPEEIIVPSGYIEAILVWLPV